MASTGSMDASTSWWNSVSTVEEFVDRAQLRGSSYHGLLHKNVEERGIALMDAVFSLAVYDMQTLGIALADEDRDTVIDFWIRVFQSNAQPATEELRAFRQRLAASRKATEQEKGEAGFETKRRQDAFDAFERPSPDLSYPSSSVLKELEHQLDLYAKDQVAWMGPYTTVIGPPGIGKSFMMKQLAVRHGRYVSYSNLAPHTAMCYPRPVVLGSIPGTEARPDRTKLVSQWERYLNQQLFFVRSSRDAGITAPGLFALMTSPTPDMVDARWELSRAMDRSSGEFKEAVAHCQRVLDRHNENVPPLTPVDGKQDAPFVLCLDEARALLHDASENMSFRALSQAAQVVFAANQDESPFFVVLLDTTSRISHFAPPIEQDPSRKSSQRKIFPPIYQINTWDLFAPKDWHSVDGTVKSVRELFSYGRPLWGANMEAGDSPFGVVRLAADKMAGGADPTRFLALLSYRINFYVTSRQLAETLIASWMRYLVSFSGDNRMLTAQPSEPVLAYASSRELQNAQVRLSCIKTWFGCLQEGACNLGDAGEMLAALVLLFSVDHVSRPLESLPHAIHMGEFWSSLAGRESWLALNRRYADVQSVLDVLANGMIFFNHFVRLAHIPTGKDLAAAYRRGAALFLPTNFPGMDIAIPVCMEDRAGGNSDLAILLIQVKNRKADSPTDGLRRALTEDLQKATRALAVGLDRPQQSVVLGMAMCLRCEGAAGVDITIPPPLRKSPKRKAKSSTPVSSAAPAAAGTGSQEPSNLLGLVFGLNAYPCLFELTAADPQQEVMTQVRSLFQDILGRWPDFYPARDTQSTYAKRLLYPFYSDGEKVDEQTATEAA